MRILKIPPHLSGRGRGRHPRRLRPLQDKVAAACSLAPWTRDRLSSSPAQSRSRDEAVVARSPLAQQENIEAKSLRSRSRGGALKTVARKREVTVTPCAAPVIQCRDCDGRSRWTRPRRQHVVDGYRRTNISRQTTAALDEGASPPRGLAHPRPAPVPPRRCPCAPPPRGR